MTVTVRTADPTDAPTIAAVLGAAFAEHRSGYTSAAYRATVLEPRRVTERLPEGPTWVAVRHDAVVATVSAHPRGAELYLRSLAVHPDARRAGIGELLIAEVIEWGINAGFARVRLDTTPFLTASLRLYLRCGFTVDDSFIGDLHGTPLVALVRELR